MEKGLPILYRFKNGLVEAYGGPRECWTLGGRIKSMGGPLSTLEIKVGF